jgi:hypothetical protein
VVDADVVRYVIEDGTDWEIGTGTYTASGTTLTRTVAESSNADAALNLTGSAVVYVSATAEDIPPVLELYAENPSSPTAPSATGTNAVAIGNGSKAASTDAIGLGVGSWARSDRTFAVFGDAQPSSIGAVAIGYSTVATGGGAARQQASAGTACAAWKIEGLIRREGSAGTTVLVNSATTVSTTPQLGAWL